MLKKLLTATLLLLTAAFTASAVEWTDTIAVINHAITANIETTPKALSLTVTGSGADHEFYYHYSAGPEGETLEGADVTDLSGCDIVVSRNAKSLNVEATGAVNRIFSIPMEDESAFDISRTYTNPALAVCSNSDGSSWSLFSSGFSVGFVGDIDSDTDMGFKMGQSMEFTLDNIAGIQWKDRTRHNTLSLGIGVNWRTYSRSGEGLLNLSDGKIGIAEVAGPEGYAPLKSRLKVFSLQFPLRYNYHWKKDFNIGLMAILNVNTHGSIKQRYRNGEGEVAKLFQNVNGQLRKVTVDFKVNLQFCPGVALYLRYSPMKVLKKDAGTQFSTLSTGLTFFY